MQEPPEESRARFPRYPNCKFPISNATGPAQLTLPQREYVCLTVTTFPRAPPLILKRAREEDTCLVPHLPPRPIKRGGIHLFFSQLPTSDPIRSSAARCALGGATTRANIASSHPAASPSVSLIRCSRKVCRPSVIDIDPSQRLLGAFHR